MAHSKDVIAEFCAGDIRLIYARRRDTGELWMLPDGEASLWREAAKTEMLCPVPGCLTPELTTVNRSRGRHGFMHYRGGGGHAPESIFHLQASEMIAVWLRANYPRSRVQKEEPSDDQRARVADVMITASTGDRMAFEIQYATLTPDRWATRHDSYANQNIADVWLFGHTGVQLRPPRSRDDQDTTLSPTHELVGESTLPMWVNPLTAQIATLVTDVRIGAEQVTVRATVGGRLLIVPLNDFRIVGRRFTCQVFEALITDSERVRVWQEREAVKAAEEAAEEAARDAARRQREAAARAVLDSKLDAEAKALEPAWLASEERADTLQRFNGVWPEFLAVDIRPPLPLPAEQWQSQIFMEFIYWGGVLQPVRSTAAAASLNLPVGHGYDTPTNVRQWFTVLIEQGLLTTRKVKRYSRVIGIEYLVLDQGLRRRQAAQAAARTGTADSGARACGTCSEPLILGTDLWRGTHRSC
jgi:hypothetical protein